MHCVSISDSANCSYSARCASSAALWNASTTFAILSVLHDHQRQLRCQPARDRYDIGHGRVGSAPCELGSNAEPAVRRKPLP